MRTKRTSQISIFAQFAAHDIGRELAETCQACSGAVKIIACIEDPHVIRKILDHLDRLAPTTDPNSLPEPRAPPQPGLFDTR